MAYTEYIRLQSGITAYAKEVPLNTGVWGTGIVSLTENGSTGTYSSSALQDGTAYEVFQNIDGTPGNEASTDLPKGRIDPPIDPNLDPALADVPEIVKKIPRADANLTDGEKAGWTMDTFTDKDNVEIRFTKVP